MEYVGRDGMNDVYIDKATDQKRFVGRPKMPDDNLSTGNDAISIIIEQTLESEQKLVAARDAQDKVRAGAELKRINESLLPKAEGVLAEGTQNVDAHFAIGLVHRVRVDYQKAALHFRQCLDLDPHHPNALLEMTKILGDQKRHDEALRYARRAVEAMPNASSWGNLAMSLIALGERVEAKEAIGKAIKLDPEDAMNQYISKNFDRYFESRIRDRRSVDDA